MILTMTDSSLNVNVQAGGSSTDNVAVTNSGFTLDLNNSQASVSVDGSLQDTLSAVNGALDLLDSSVVLEIVSSAESTVAMASESLTIDNSSVDINVNCQSGQCEGASITSLDGNNVVDISSTISGLCTSGACSAISFTSSGQVTNSQGSNLQHCI